MANTILTKTEVTRESVRLLVNNIVMPKLVNREYDGRFAQTGAKIGATLTIRKPNRFTVTTGAALSLQDITEPSVVLTIDTQDHVDTNFTSQELTLSMDDFSRRILKPKIQALGNKIDLNGLLLYKDVYNTVGTVGVTPATALAVLSVGQRLDEEAVDVNDDRALVINPAANAGLVDGLKGLFNAASRVGDQYNTGNMGNALGFEMSKDQNVARHTVGALGGTPLVSGANQTGTSLLTKGWTSAAAPRLKKGDVFTLAGVNAVNPQSRVSTGSLRQFTVTADFSSDGSGNGTVSISPAMTLTGPYQTVDALAADSAAITLVGTAAATFPVNLGFGRDAFTLATVDLEDMSQYGGWGAREVFKGISLRVWRQSRIGTDDVPCRIDVLYGWKTIYPEMACRLVG